MDINREDVEVGHQMKYLTITPITINSQWTPFETCCRISVGLESKCADYTSELSVSGSCAGLRCGQEI